MFQWRRRLIELCVHLHKQNRFFKIATTEGQFQKEMSTTSSRKTVATTTKMVAASSSSTTTSLSVQQDATTVAENATIVKDEDKNVSVRKMKKVKKGKENISVVSRMLRIEGGRTRGRRWTDN